MEKLDLDTEEEKKALEDENKDCSEHIEHLRGGYGVDIVAVSEG